MREIGELDSYDVSRMFRPDVPHPAAGRHSVYHVLQIETEEQVWFVHHTMHDFMWDQIVDEQ